jgi:hypothetical protein
VLYDVPTTPDGSVGVVIASAPFTTMLRFAVAVAEVESVTFAVKENVPVEVGVPVISPVLTFNVRPGGKLPELMLHI